MNGFTDFSSFHSFTHFAPVEHWSYDNEQIKTQGGRIETQADRGEKKATSDEADACCYADHKEGNGKRRAREKQGRQKKYVRQIELNPPLSGRVMDGPAGAVKGSELHGTPRRRIRRKRRRRVQNPTGIHLLNLLISDAALSQRDSAPFITFTVCVCVGGLFEQKQILS